MKYKVEVAPKTFEIVEYFNNNIPFKVYEVAKVKFPNVVNRNVKMFLDWIAKNNG